MLKLIKKIFGLDHSTPLNLIDYKNQGNEWLASGDLAAAAQCYRKAIDAHPEQLEGYVNLGFVLSEQQDYQAAVNFLQKALAISPNDIDSLYLLGSINYKQGKSGEALKYFNQVIDIDSSFEPAYEYACQLLFDENKIEAAESLLLKGIANNHQQAELNHMLGELYAYTNKPDKAIQSFNAALKIEPEKAKSHCKLADILQQQEKTEQAITHYRKALIAHPEYIEAYNNLAATLQSQKKIDEAIECFQKAINFDPLNAQLYFNLGNALKDKKAYRESISSYQKAVECDPNYSQAYINLAVAFKENDEIDNAINSCKKALSINPDFAEAEYCLANLFNSIGNVTAAIECYQKAIHLKPDYSDAYSNLGLIFHSNAKYELAISQYEKAIAHKADFASAYNGMGCTLQEINRFDEAIECFRKAISIQSDFGDAYNNLAGVLRMQHRDDEAVKCYQMALSIMPDSFPMRSNLLFTQSMDGRYASRSYLIEAQDYGKQVAKKAAAYSDWLMSLSANDNKPLRIGFVSGDLCKHPVGYFLENIVACIDAKRLQLFAYTTVSKKDDLTQRLREYFTSWVDIVYLSDVVAAKKIRDDRVDILIDLAGHTAHNRLSLFAWKPAPLQVTWLGYWASTGVSEIDYVLADEVSLPTEHQNQFTEKAWYLPSTRMCFSAPTELSMVSPPPAIKTGYITFGSFQAIVKMNDEVLALWGRVLKELPTARLRLQNKQLGDKNMQTLLRGRLEAAGISSERIIMQAAVSRERYLEAHREVDIILDTFPFSGGTTTCEALWMGVPTVTLAGDTMIARQGASMLACAGLSDWIANTKAEYINTAINKARDVNALAQLRLTLRDQVARSPLFNAELFARYFEKAMHEMWKEKMKTYADKKEEQ